MNHRPPYSGPLLDTPSSARSAPLLPPLPFLPYSPSPLASLPPFYPPVPLPPLIDGQWHSPAQLSTLQSTAMLHSADSDAFSGQMMKRRYHLLIRSAPTNSNASQRTARKQQSGTRRIVQSTEAVASGPESSAVIRSQARLPASFGPESSSLRKQRRARRRQQEAHEAEQRHIAITTRDREREANRPAKLIGPSPATLHAAAATAAAGKNSSSISSGGVKQQQSSASSSSNPSSSSVSASVPAARHSKQILHFLTSTSPPKHRFFAHLPRPPTLTADTARAICDEIGSDALEHLRILSAQQGQYDSLHALMQALRQSESFEHEQRESAERRKRHPFPERDILEGRGVGNAFDVTAASQAHEDRAAAPSGAFASEQERAIAAVSAADRDRLIAYLTSSPLHPEIGPDTYLAPASTAAAADGSQLHPTPVPSTCTLFSDAPSETESDGAEITATPREIAQLIVENGGIERTLHTLITLDSQLSAATASASSSSSRGFPSFHALVCALRAQSVSREEARRDKEALRDYFARGAEAWRKERTAAARLGRHKDASPADAGAGATAALDASSPALPIVVVPVRSPRRDVPTPPSCRLFLHLAQLPAISAADIDRLYADSGAGRDTLLHCRSLDARGELLSSFQQLIDRVRELQRNLQQGGQVQ